MGSDVLICEDDMSLSDLLQRVLRDRGHSTMSVREGHRAVDLIQHSPPDLFILDLMLPDMDGLDVCRQVRQHCTVPIMMISARSGELDRIVGLEIGGDDFLCKPFGCGELAARAEALLRRCWELAGVPNPEALIHAGDIAIDRAGHTVRVRDEEVRLTPKEFALLCALAENRGSVCHSSQLLLKVWGYDANIRTRTLDVHIGRLRAKIEPSPREPRYIVTVAGYGYKLVCQATPEQAA